jgi:hypothetical protein
VSAAEGNRFAQVVSELTDQVRELGPWPGHGPSQPEGREGSPDLSSLPVLSGERSERQTAPRTAGGGG